MATIRAHEFISLDGVFESPSWTMDFGFDPAMGETLAHITGASDDPARPQDSRDVRPGVA